MLSIDFSFARLAALVFLLSLTVLPPGLAFAAGSAPPPDPPVAQDERVGSLLAMRALDSRVAAIGHRLAVSNAALCGDTRPLPGFVLHDLSQYGSDFRAAAARAFGFERGTAVLAVVRGGPAEEAGLREDDLVLRVDGWPLPQLEPGSGFSAVERILDRVDDAFADGSARVDLMRRGTARSLEIPTVPGCRTRYQLMPSRDMNALADGRYVQVTTRFAAYAADDDELAWILAHELAHNILRHRERLDAAGVRRGLLAQFGRNARLIRETEAEADRLSVHLLDRAGYDIEASIRFWSRFGRSGLNFLGSPTHGSHGARIARLNEEIAAVRRSRAAGREPVPPFVPLSADGIE